MRIIFSTLFTFLISLSLGAQIMWKITGNGAKNESFIFGTHHVAPYSITDSVPGFKDAIQSVDAVVGEVDLVNLAPVYMQQLTMRYATAPSDSTLSKVMTSQQIDSLNTVLAKYTQGMLSARGLNSFKPAMISTFLTLAQTSSIFPDYDQTQQLDNMILNLGHDLGKTLDGLESLEEQLRFLFNSPISAQVDDLMSAVRNDDEAKIIAQRLANAYMERDLQQIHEVMKSELDNDTELAKKLLTDRNNRWVKKLLKQLSNESLFIVVGCGHLPGEDGLIKLLQNHGFTLTPVE